MSEFWAISNVAINLNDSEEVKNIMSVILIEPGF